MIMQEKEFKHIVRIMNTDLFGEKPIGQTLNKIKGVSFMFSHALCTTVGVDKKKKTGHLLDEEIKKLNEAIKNPSKYNIPLWLFNRRKDYEEGTDRHILTSDLDFIKSNDIKRLQKIKSNRGMRHAWNLPLRGQRTKSNFRKNKGKVTGVKKKKGKEGRV